MESGISAENGITAATPSNSIDFSHMLADDAEEIVTAVESESLPKPISDADISSSPSAESMVPDTTDASEPSSIDTCDASLPALQIFLGTTVAVASPSRTDPEALQHRLAHLQTVLAQRDAAAALHTRELAVQQREQHALRTALAAARTQADAIVVRYATAEKALLDERSASATAAKRARAAAKECEALTARLKFVSGERDRAQREHRKVATESEALRQELCTAEARLKAAQMRQQREAELRAAADAKIAELTAERQTMRTAERTQQQHARQEERESDVQLILLKHAHAERERECDALRASVEELRAAGEELRGRLADSAADAERLRVVVEEQQGTIAAAERANEEQSNRVVALQAGLSEAEAQMRDNAEQLTAAAATAAELSALRPVYEELEAEAQRMRAHDDELLQFTQRLTEKTVDVEERLLLATARGTALDLEVAHVRAAFEQNRLVAVRLEAELRACRAERDAEREEAERMVAQANAERLAMRESLENGLGELEVCRRKNGQVVKELQRDVVALRTKCEAAETKGTAQRNGGGAEVEQQQQPSRKSLIDRIAKLQRILARQTEKIEFLENHCAGLVNQLKQRGGGGADGKQIKSK